jgi:hypothetical protein
LKSYINPNTAIGSSSFTAAIAAARQGYSWTVFFNTEPLRAAMAYNSKRSTDCATSNRGVLD